MEDGSLVSMDEAPKPKPSILGWDKPTPLNYEALQAMAGTNNPAAPAGDNKDGTEEAVDAEPAWASGAAKYEWQDEYGDLAPELPELERHLFTTDGSSQMGEFMSTLTEFAVTQESDTQFKPINNVSHPVCSSLLHPNILYSSRMLACIR